KVVRAYRRTVSDVIVRWAVRVEFYAGDGGSACFGYPQAHEDDAERAVRAGLEIVRALGAPDPRDAAEITHALSTLVVRVGIHTGPVVVGDLGSDEHG